MTPDEIRAALGDDVVVTDAYGQATADVPPERWTAALTAARDVLGLRFFDWLSAVDESPEGFAVIAHICAAPGPRLLLRTHLPRTTPHVATATGVYAGAAWHERETAEMFGITFDHHPHPAPLLLPDGFEGHPLRKDFVLASRVAKPWPGAKDPGGSGPGRRTLPPGVPSTWGPTEPPPTQHPTTDQPPTTPDTPADRPRRTRRASEGSASQRAEVDQPPVAPDSPTDRAHRASSRPSSGPGDGASEPEPPSSPSPEDP